MTQFAEPAGAQGRPHVWLFGLLVTACWALPAFAQAQESETIATARYGAVVASDVAPEPQTNSTDPLAAPASPAAPMPGSAQSSGALPGVPEANRSTANAPAGLRPFVFTPLAGVQETYTDNAFVTATDRRSDFITRGIIGFDLSVDDGPSTGTATVRADYDEYARNSSLSGFSVQGYASGSYALVPNFLSLEAAGTATNGNVSELGSPGVDRSGVAGRYQFETYDVGPHMTTPIGGFADLDAFAHFSQVIYSEADSSAAALLPSDANIVEVGGTLDTGARFTKLESLTSADYESDNQGFRTAGALESLFFSVSPVIRVFGRAGYESDYLPGIANINAPLLSAGVEYRPNDQSKISIEGGERYNRAAWVASAYVQLSDRLLLTADYQQVLEPDQIYTANSFIDFVQLTGSVPSSFLSPNFSVNGNLYNAPSLDTTADAHIIYHWPRQTIDAFVEWRDRDFLNATGHDRTVTVEADATRQLRPDLQATVSGSYVRTYSSPLFGASVIYSLAAQIVYNVNSTVDLHAGYNFDDQKELSGAEFTIYENAVFVALSKRF